MFEYLLIVPTSIGIAIGSHLAKPYSCLLYTSPSAAAKDSWPARKQKQSVDVYKRQEEWFIKRSSYTGQETFFPKEQILGRIQAILEAKDVYSLEELAKLFSLSLIHI